MIRLYSYPELFGIADNNGYGLKVFAFMRLARRAVSAWAHFRAVNRPNNHQATGDSLMLLVLINVLIIVVIGALLFYLIDRFVRDGRLANLLKILVVLICLAAILQRLLPVLGIGF
jgi:hypothetical protein